MNHEKIGEVLVIDLPARLDAVGVAAIEGPLADLISAHKGQVLANMGEVNFVASLALRMLLTQLKSAQNVGGDLRLCAMQPQISEIFRKSRFDTLFKIYPDRETALAAYTA